ncbi:MAG: hypothetical protein AAGU19_00580 [Prolixibacteraceae bacterium]
MRVYSNFHTTFSDGESVSAFELTRVYLGYAYQFSENFSALANIDVADPGVGGLEMTAFVKNAYLNYKTDELNIFFGMIPTTQFKIQEAFWRYRYIEKSYQDAYDFNSSADLGVSMAYKLTKFLSADMIIANGEGYKKLQSDSVLRTGFGVTVEPTDKLTGRMYYDFSSKATTYSSLAFFAGYAGEKLSIAAEYNRQTNYRFLEDHDLSGPSFYGTLCVSKKINLFARYDKLISNMVSGTEADWNVANDGELYMAGFEFNPVKGVKLAPNFRGWSPAAAGEPFSSSFFLNCEFKL